MSKKGFTLVELIVVITILTILGTIAFLSFGSYNQSARDSVRRTDIKNISTSLELFVLEKGKYPTNQNGALITYSGGLLWTQGSINEQIRTNLGKLSKIPKDPLTGYEYQYSVLHDGSSYQLGYLYENNYASTTIFPQAIADYTGYGIVGNYNGVLTKISLNNKDYILALPSIMMTASTGSDVRNLIGSGQLVLNGWPYYKSNNSNIPTMLNGSSYVWGINPDNIVAYSGTMDTIHTTTGSALIANRLQNIYSGSLLAQSSSISELMNINTQTNQTGASLLVRGYVLGTAKKNLYTNAQNGIFLSNPITPPVTPPETPPPVVYTYTGVLDIGPTSAAAAYSLRKLRRDYTGNVIRVRRSSDNTEQDIGFGSPNIAQNRNFLSDTSWDKGSGVTIAGGVVSVSNAARIINQNMGLITGKTYRVTIIANKTGSSSAARLCITTSSSLTTEGLNQVLQAPNPANGIQIIQLDIVANNPTLSIAADSAVWSGTISFVSVQDVTSGVLQNDINEASLLSFCGVSSCFVNTWYDQSGNGRNALQTTAANQPRIINNGVMDIQNTKPMIYFDGTSDVLNASTTQIGGKLLSINIVTKMDVGIPTNNAYARPISLGVNGTASWATPGHVTLTRRAGTSSFGIENTDAGYAIATSTNSSITNSSITNTPFVYTALLSDTTHNAAYNGVETSNWLPLNTPDTWTFTNIRIGQDNANNNDTRLLGNVGEIIISPTRFSVATRNSIERNQGSYYGISVQ